MHSSERVPLGDAEYLNVFETHTGTPFFQDAYVTGLRVGLTIAPTGSGKSVHSNLAATSEQNYNGFTYIFDIGASYESVVELYGGKVDRVGKDGPRVNPFALEPTTANLQFLHAFTKLLLTNAGAELSPEDENTVFRAVRDLYHLPSELRRLGQLFLPPHLQRYLSKWIVDGIYAAVFDNVQDSLSLSRIQCFDFQGIAKQYADLIEPLMVWLLRRIDNVLFDPPQISLNGHPGEETLTLDAPVGHTVHLTAAGTTDPDPNQHLTYRWIHYREAGAADGNLAALTLSTDTGPELTITPTSPCSPLWLPLLPCKGPGTARLILAVTDDGHPALIHLPPHPFPGKLHC